MDAKQVQLVLAGLVAAGLVGAIADVAYAYRSGSRPAVGSRRLGVILTGLGAGSFAVLAAAASGPHPGWEPAHPSDAGWDWAWWIMPAAAVMLATWALLGTMRPRHAAFLLVGAAGLIPAFVILAWIVGGASSSPDEPSVVMLVGASAVAFSVPAVLAGFAFISEQRRVPADRG